MPFYIQKWPAGDPVLDHLPPYAEFGPWHVRRIYKKEEIKRTFKTGFERIWLKVLVVLGVGMSKSSTNRSAVPI